MELLAIGRGPAADAIVLGSATPRAEHASGSASVRSTSSRVSCQIALAIVLRGYLADHRELIAAGGWRVVRSTFPNCAT